MAFYLKSIHIANIKVVLANTSQTLIFFGLLLDMKF
jgi:hypothetical protein